MDKAERARRRAAVRRGILEGTTLLYCQAGQHQDCFYFLLYCACECHKPKAS